MSYAVEIPDDRYFRGLVKCQDACPVGTDARGYVRAIAEGDFERAYLIARGPNPLASICGRVCGAPCEAACRRGALDAPVSIRALKRTTTERFGSESGKHAPLEVLRRALELREARHENEGEEELLSLLRDHSTKTLGEFPPDAPRVAIIGAGPAGLACAHDLALFGVRSVVFDREREPAGMLIYGIPEYRLPRDLIRAEVETIRALGVEFRCDTSIGTDIRFDELLAEFDAVVVAVGAKNSARLPLEGAGGPGVLGGVELLREIALDEEPEGLTGKVVVIGGGNVAYDVARSVVRQIGFDVSRTARRHRGVESVILASLENLEEMPADDVEILEGAEEGVERINSVGPVRVERDSSGQVTGMTFKPCLRVFDEEGRFSPQFDEENQRTIPCSCVVFAIGQRIDLGFIDSARDGVKLTERGFIEYDPEHLTTSNPKVFVVGDAAYGPRLLIHAVASGKKAAREIVRRLSGEDLTPELGETHRELPEFVRETGYERIPRTPVPALPAEERIRSQAAQVERGYSEEQACGEASRCFDCGVNPIFDGTRCVLCGGCVDVCPESCLKIISFDRLESTPDVKALQEAFADADEGEGEGEELSAIIKDEELCIRCALCAERCPNHAITMERFCFGGTSQ
jgi:formate dehydrogenase (NADP+) beta subunit